MNHDTTAVISVTAMTRHLDLDVQVAPRRRRKRRYEAPMVRGNVNRERSS